LVLRFINDAIRIITIPRRSARSGERPEGAKPSAREPTAGGSASRGEVGEAGGCGEVAVRMRYGCGGGTGVEAVIDPRSAPHRMRQMTVFTYICPQDPRDRKYPT